MRCNPTSVQTPQSFSPRFCRRLLKVYDGLWTFVEVEGVVSIARIVIKKFAKRPYSPKIIICLFVMCQFFKRRTGMQFVSSVRCSRTVLATLSVIVTLGFSMCSLGAAESTFVFGNHGAKHNNIVINSQTDLETIITVSNDVKGEVKWDRDAKTGSASLTVPVLSLSTGIKDRDTHLQSESWLNAAKNPNITLVTTAIKHKEGDLYEVSGNFTLNGVSKAITTVATVKYIAFSSDLKKAHMPNGNLMRISAEFEIKLSDFNIKVPAVPINVSDTLKISLNLMGVDEVK
jgi:polyisoprenoid-binding protein YceI